MIVQLYNITDDVSNAVFVTSFLSPFAELLFDLSGYINSPSLSDVELVLDDGSRFHAHRLVLCSQSPVFKAMMDSELWAESANKEVQCAYIAYILSS